MNDLKTTVSADVERYILNLFDQQLVESSKENLNLDAILIPTKQFCLYGGKRIRPLLVRTAYELIHPYSEQEVLPVMVAVELLHQYLMMLDDVADRDEFRHNHPTLETYFQKTFQSDQKTLKDSVHLGRTFSEISSALHNTLVTDSLFQSTATPSALTQILKYMNSVMYRQTVAGWKTHFLQNYDSIKNVTIDQYMNGLRLVSANYTFVGPLQIGLMIQSTEEHATYAKILQEFGENIGTAFQLQDDILGVFGDSKKTGKPVGNDLREGKKTRLVQKAYSRSTNVQKSFIEDHLGTTMSDQDTALFQELIQQTGALQESQDQISELTVLGIQALDELPSSANAQSILILQTLAESLQNREV